MQETFLRAWKAFDRFEGKSSMRTWLHRIATNTCLTRAGGPSASAAADRARHADSDPTAELVERREVPWLEPLPDHRRPGRPRGHCRVPRVGAVGFRRRAAAPLPAAAGGAAAARRAAVELRRGGRGDRHLHDRGQQPAAAGPVAAGRRRARRRGSPPPIRRRPRTGWPATSRPSRPTTSTGWWSCSPRRRSGRCRPTPAGIRARAIITLIHQHCPAEVPATCGCSRWSPTASPPRPCTCAAGADGAMCPSNCTCSTCAPTACRTSWHSSTLVCSRNSACPRRFDVSERGPATQARV